MTASDLTKGEQSALTVVSQVFSSFSVAGSLFIILSFSLFPKLRKFSYKLVLWLSVSDLVNQSTSYFGNPNDNAFECFVQAAGMQFFSVASFMWTVCIAHVLRSTVVGKRADIEDAYPRMHTLVWTAAALSTLVPSWKYGPTGAWCWIEGDDLTGKILRFACYYAPLWFAIGYNVYAYYCVIRTLRRVQLLANSMRADANQPKFEMKAVSRLGWYPSILIFTHIVGTVNRIQNWLRPQSPVFWLFVSHTATSSLLGFLNSIAYGFNRAVRSQWHASLSGFRDRIRHRRTGRDEPFHRLDMLSMHAGASSASHDTSHDDKSLNGNDSGASIMAVGARDANGT